MPTSSHGQPDTPGTAMRQPQETPADNQLRDDWLLARRLGGSDVAERLGGSGGPKESGRHNGIDKSGSEHRPDEPGRHNGPDQSSRHNASGGGVRRTGRLDAAGKRPESNRAGETGGFERSVGLDRLRAPEWTGSLVALGRLIARAPRPLRALPAEAVPTILAGVAACAGYREAARVARSLAVVADPGHHSTRTTHAASGPALTAPRNLDRVHRALAIVAARAVAEGDSSDDTLGLVAAASAAHSASQPQSAAAPAGTASPALLPAIVLRILLGRRDLPGALRLLGLTVAALLRTPRPCRRRQLPLFHGDADDPVWPGALTANGVGHDPTPLTHDVFDLPALAQIIVSAPGGVPLAVARRVMADAPFMIAVLFGAAGLEAGARAHLAASARPLPDRDLVLLWTALTHRAGKAAADLVAWLRRQADRADVASGAEAFTGVPDPSVAAATPLPMILGGRTAWSTRLMRNGHRAQFHALRRILQRPELLARHAPWWLVGPDQAKEVVLAFSTACRLIDRPQQKSYEVRARRPILSMETAGVRPLSSPVGAATRLPSRGGEAP